MTVEEVVSLSSKNPKLNFTINLPSNRMSYRVLMFRINTGNLESDYFAVFTDNKLMYWGHPYEFKRYPDPIVQEIGNEALSEADRLR